MNLKVIKNFFDSEDLRLISSLNLSKKADDKKSIVYHNKITKEGEVESDLFNHETLKSFHKKYHPVALKILKELCPEKVDLYEYSEFHLVETGKDFHFPIHDDIPNKLLSGVVYIKPEKNSGTVFYETKSGKGKNTIEWEINKAIFFSRVERKTWHSYSGDGKSNRVTIVYNLMTDDIKRVFAAEKTNSLLGKFRNFINPHLFKFFKITI
tara:strand:+ start:4113 stop:4742 length:630 start_codon:yes stop_codon:yes gene_type:complete